MNFSTTANDFTTLKNGIDSRLEIIRHDETGFYNITKARNIVHSIKSAENEAGDIPPASLKPAKRWFLNDATQEISQSV